MATRMLEILGNLLYIKISHRSDICTMILIDFNILLEKLTNRTLKLFIKAQRTFLLTIFLPRVTMDSLLMICPTIYQSSHSVTLMLILQQLSLRKVLPFATSLVRILMHLTTFCVNSIGIL